MSEYKYENREIEIDRQKVQPAIDEALSNGRLISKINITEDVWLQTRAVLGIGASEVSMPLNCSKYVTPYQFWKNKVSQTIEVANNKNFEWGHLLEPLISSLYEKRTGLKLDEDPFIRLHHKYDCLFANLDRIVVKDGIIIGIVEIKSTVRREFKRWQKEESDDCIEGIPLTYYMQVQQQLDVLKDFPNVSETLWCDLAIGIIDEKELETKRFHLDNEYAEKQSSTASAWWNAFVVPNVAPPMTSIEYSFAEPIQESFIEATGDIAETYSNLKSKKAILKSLEKEIDAEENKIKEFIGDKENLVLINTVIATWKMQSRTSIDSKKLKSELPDISEKYSKTSNFRILRLKEIQ